MGVVWDSPRAKDDVYESQREGPENLEDELSPSHSYILIKVFIKRKAPNPENIENVCKEPLAVTLKVTNHMPCPIWELGDKDEMRPPP